MQVVLAASRTGYQSSTHQFHAPKHRCHELFPFHDAFGKLTLRSAGAARRARQGIDRRGQIAVPA
jgi:hypothetical protein